MVNVNRYCGVVENESNVLGIVDGTDRELCRI